MASIPVKGPIHEKIAGILRGRILSGAYAEDELIPPEMVLVSEFDVSRHTMREALRALVEEGLIERSRGRGTIVSPRSRRAERWGLRTINDLMKEFDDSQIILLRREALPARSHPEVARKFGLGGRSFLYFIHRIMCLKDGPAAVHRLFTTQEFAAKLPQEEVGYKPLIGQIEAHCAVQAFRTRQIASAVAAGKEVSDLLGVRVGSPMLRLQRSYLTKEDHLLVETELICRPDRYEQTVDFYREPAGRLGPLPP